jgi:hypothetical protein
VEFEVSYFLLQLFDLSVVSVFFYDTSLFRRFKTFQFQIKLLLSGGFPFLIVLCNFEPADFASSVVVVCSQPAAERGVGGPDHAGYVDRITPQAFRSQDLESLITPTPVQNSDA